jgi:hypothetical protein
LFQADILTDIPQCSQLNLQLQRTPATHPCNFSLDGPLHSRDSNKVTTKTIQDAYKLSEDFITFVSITRSESNIWSRTMFTSHHFQRRYQNCESTSTPQSGTPHKTCLRGFGGNGSIAWTSAVSQVGRTSNAFKVTTKLQTFLFQMVVTSCISVQYL